MSCKNPSELWKKIFELVIFVSALTLFSIQIKDVVRKFFDRRTTIAMREELSEVQYLPDITFHVFNGFQSLKMKKLGLSNWYDFDDMPLNKSKPEEHDYYQTTYALRRELNISATIPGYEGPVGMLTLGENMFRSLANNDTYVLNVIQTNSRTKGLYYTLRTNIPFKTNGDDDDNVKMWIMVTFDWSTLNLHGPKGPKIYGYVNDASEHYRYFAFEWNGVKKMIFDVHPSKKVALHLSKTTRKSLSQGDKDKCHHYDANDSEMKCRLRKIAKLARLYMEANCSSICTNPPFGTLMSLANIDQSNLCKTELNAKCMFDGYYHGVEDSPEAHKSPCLPSCTKFEYDGEIEYLEASSWDPTFVWIKIQFSSDKERVFDEILLFDFSSFIGNVGGSLGLFIGFSYFQFAKRLSSSFVDAFASWKK